MRWCNIDRDGRNPHIQRNTPTSAPKGVKSKAPAIFRVALYRFATQGDVPGHFSTAQLDAAFQPHRRGRR